MILDIGHFILWTDFRYTRLIYLLLFFLLNSPTSFVVLLAVHFHTLSGKPLIIGLLLTLLVIGIFLTHLINLLLDCLSIPFSLIVITLIVFVLFKRKAIKWWILRALFFYLIWTTLFVAIYWNLITFINHLLVFMLLFHIFK